MGQIFIKILLWVAIFIACSSASISHQDPNQVSEQVAPVSYRFGVFPYMSPVRLQRVYSPITEAISNEIDAKIKFRTASTFEKFLQNLRENQYDFALIQPFWYPVAVDESSYLPLVRMEEPFVAQILVLENSEIKTANELKGQIIATPPSFVPVVHLAKLALAENGIDPSEDVNLKAFKNIDSCFQQLLINSAKACVAPPFAPGLFEKAMNVKLRNVLTSPSIPNLALVAHPRVPQRAREQVKSLFTSWKNEDDGSQLLERIQTEGFVNIQDAEYDIVRQYIEELGL